MQTSVVEDNHHRDSSTYRRASVHPLCWVAEEMLYHSGIMHRGYLQWNTA